MRILYVAKHDKGCNDNEGAITYALRKLGHDVIRLHERNFFFPKSEDKFDLLLFQNWKGIPLTLRQIDCPKVFWYFDRVDYGTDQILASWTAYRRSWMSQTIPQVDLGFCTDGDWVDQDRSGKLVHLMQGADERHARFAPYDNQSGIYFFGSVYGRGEGRSSFLREMKAIYKSTFRHETNTFGKNLFNKVSSASIVVAPDGPISDLYYSNRPYVMSSLGAFVLHPYCATLAEHYEEDREMVFYRSRNDLHSKIQFYLSHPSIRLQIARAGFKRTVADHTYLRRLQTIFNTLETRNVLPKKETSAC